MSLGNTLTRKKSKPICGLRAAANSEVEIDEEDVKKKQGTVVTLSNEKEEKLIITPRKLIIHTTRTSWHETTVQTTIVILQPSCGCFELILQTIHSWV